jgi:hypothetical protein
MHCSGKIVRDPGVSKKFDAVQAKHGYFLRPRVISESHVDHVCECQFIGHAVVQSPAFQAGAGASILASVDVTHAHNPGHFGMSSQPKDGVAYNALRPLYTIQVSREPYPPTLPPHPHTGAQANRNLTHTRATRWPPLELRR